MDEKILVIFEKEHLDLTCEISEFFENDEKLGKIIYICQIVENIRVFLIKMAVSLLVVHLCLFLRYFIPVSNGRFIFYYQMNLCKVCAILAIPLIILGWVKCLLVNSKYYREYRDEDLLVYHLLNERGDTYMNIHVKKGWHNRIKIIFDKDYTRTLRGYQLIGLNNGVIYKVDLINRIIYSRSEE